MTESITIKQNSLSEDFQKTMKKGELFSFSDKELRFQVHTAILDCEEYWDTIRNDDPFFSPEYFGVIEKNNLGDALPMYAFVFLKDESEPIAFYHLQKKHIRLADSIDTDKFIEGNNFWAKLKYRLQKIFFPMVYFNMMIVGNLLLTGKYGFQGTNGSISDNDYSILKRLLRGLKKEVRRTPYKFRGAMIKDFAECDTCSDANKMGLGQFQVDPSMALPIRPDWNSMDDYLLDMKSKHRVRTKKHLKAGTQLNIRSLSLSEAQNLNHDITHLYNSVVKASGFNLATVSDNYFLQLMESFPDRFTLKGMFIDDKLVGFYTYMLKEGTMMSHFIGYDESQNKQHSIYMNILLGLIRDSIEMKVKKLLYYRTALEIKSSVGAEPEPLSLYLMHNNSILNKLVGFVIKTFFPVPVWTQRRPFKNYPEK